MIMIREITKSRPDAREDEVAGHFEKAVAEKKIPEPKPKAASLNFRSAFICKAANPTLTRSSHATT